MAQDVNSDVSLADRGLEIRQSFLKFPGENPEVDYKAAMPFIEGDDFSLKLVKHILGMSNAGGGFLVIGFKENESKNPEAEDVSDAILATYDLTKIAQYVEKFTVGTERISVVVHKDTHPDTGKVYPIIQVFSFPKRPFFCKSTKGPLQEGALYIRIASARTIKIATPDDWEHLIDLCVERRQEDTLSRFSSILKEVGLPSIPSSKLANPKYDREEKWIEERRNEVQALCEEHGYTFEGLEVSHWIDSSESVWSSTELLAAATRAARRNTGWPIGIVLHNRGDSPIPMEDGIKVVVNAFNRLDYWYLHQSGQFYFFRTYEEGTISIHKDEDTGQTAVSKLHFDTRIWRTAESIDHCIALYQALSISPTALLQLRINHNGLNNRHLSASNPDRAFTMWGRICKADVSQWSSEISLDLLQVERKDIIFKVCKKLYSLFEFWEPSDSALESVLVEYEQSRT